MQGLWRVFYENRKKKRLLFAYMKKKLYLCGGFCEGCVLFVKAGHIEKGV